jgi:hypothetical protein
VATPTTAPRFTWNQRRALLAIGAVALVIAVALFLRPLDKTTTATVTGASPSVTVTHETDRSDTFAIALFALGAVLAAAGAGVSLGFGGASVQAALANERAALMYHAAAVATAHERALTSGNERAIAATTDALNAVNDAQRRLM